MGQRGSIRRGVATVWSDDRGSILVAVAGGWFLSIGVRLVYPVLLPNLREAFGLDLGTAGLLLTVLWVGYALGQLPGGVVADRIGEGRVLVASSAISAVTIALVATATSASILFAATALFGFGTALYGVARYTALSDVFPDNDGTAIGLTLAAGEFGNAVLPPVAGLIAGALAWQFGFGFTVPLFLVAAGFLWVAVPARTSGPESAVDSFSLETVRYVLASIGKPTILLAAFIQLLGFGVWQAFTGFYPTYLIEVKDLSPAFATGLFGAFFALGMVVQPLAGAAYDRYGIRRALPLVLGAATIGLGLVPVLEGPLPIAAVTVLVSGLLGLTVMTMPYLTATLPTDVQGTGLGTLRTVLMVIGAGSPAVAGALAERNFFDEVFVLFAVVGGVAIVLSRFLPKQ